jgi:cell division transport system permease protein
MRAASCWPKGSCTSMTEPEAPAQEGTLQEATRQAAPPTLRRRALAFARAVPAFEIFLSRSALTPILPARSITGRALMLVVVIMTFLAGLTAGAVHLIADASAAWSREIAREVTIQVRPLTGRNIETDIARVAELARSTRGIANVRIFSREEGEKLLEPWLGAGLDLAELPVPRLVVLSLASETPDWAALKQRLAELAPTASLDDHRLWLSRLKAMARMLVVVGVIILALVLVATGLAVTFATHGAMAGTAHIIEVLHLVGAEDSYIAREFQRHFLRLGLKGALMGGGLAVAFYLLVSLSSARFATTPGAEQVEALFGRFSLPGTGYLSVLAIALVVSALTAVVSRITVFRSLSEGEG